MSRKRKALHRKARLKTVFPIRRITQSTVAVAGWLTARKTYR